MRWSSAPTTSLPPSVRVLARSCHARAEKRLELRQTLVECRRYLAGAAGHALIKGVDVITQGLGHILRALAKPANQLAAVVFHRMVELCDVPGDQVAEVA